MASVTAKEVDWKWIYCPESLVLPDCFGVSLASAVHSMNSTKDQRASSPLTSELAVDKREGFNAGGRGHAVTLRQRNKGRNG